MNRRKDPYREQHDVSWYDDGPVVIAHPFTYGALVGLLISAAIVVCAVFWWPIFDMIWHYWMG